MSLWHPSITNRAILLFHFTLLAMVVHVLVQYFGYERMRRDPLITETEPLRV